MNSFFNKICLIFFASLTFIIFLPSAAYSQAMPEVLNEGALEEQYDYLHQQTRIYNNFRAVREDMFQKIRQNSLDSLRAVHRELNNQKNLTADMLSEKDSLIQLQQITAEQRDEAIRDRDSLFLLGMPINKTFYNLLLWSVIGGLAILLLIIFLMFQRSFRVTKQKIKDFNELQTEYEEYRKTSRERYEQQSIDHFNEIKRIKGL